MAKEKGKRFKIPTPIFDTRAFETFKAVVVNEYRKITFDKSNPRMSDDKPFPKYTSVSYENRKKSQFGDKSAFEQLVVRHQDLVFSLAY